MSMTYGSGFEWMPQDDNEAITAEIIEVTPDNSEFLEWAAQPENQPPESWWNETEDPFI